MTTPLATPGDMVDLHPSTMSFDAKQLTVLVKTQDVEIIQLLIPKGSSIPTYEAEGEIILHCVEFSKEFIQLHSLKVATDISQMESAPTAPAVS